MAYRRRITESAIHVSLLLNGLSPSYGGFLYIRAILVGGLHTYETFGEFYTFGYRSCAHVSYIWKPVNWASILRNSYVCTRFPVDTWYPFVKLAMVILQEDKWTRATGWR